MAKNTPTPFGRAVAIPRMGVQPRLIGGFINRPDEIPNPMHVATEPFSFPRETMQKPATVSSVPRRVTEADIADILSWGVPRFQRRYPRCTEESVRPMLLMALRSSQFCFLCTDMAAGLFVAERTPWEPELTVQDVFIVAKARQKVEEGVSQTEAPDLYHGRAHAANILRVAFRWAVDVGAVAFHYGSSTGVDIEPMAEASGVGFDGRNVGLTKHITPEMRAALVA